MLWFDELWLKIGSSDEQHAVFGRVAAHVTTISRNFSICQLQDLICSFSFVATRDKVEHKAMSTRLTSGAGTGARGQSARNSRRTAAVSTATPAHGTGIRPILPTPQTMSATPALVPRGVPVHTTQSSVSPSQTPARSTQALEEPSPGLVSSSSGTSSSSSAASANFVWGDNSGQFMGFCARKLNEVRIAIFLSLSLFLANFVSPFMFWWN